MGEITKLRHGRSLEEPGESIWCLTAFPAWIGMLSLSFFFYTAEDPFLPKMRSQGVFYLQTGALALFLCVSFAAARHRSDSIAFVKLGRVGPQSLISWFFIYLLLAGLFSKSPFIPLSYTVLTWVSVVMGALSWPQEPQTVRRSFSLSAGVLLLILLGLFAVFGYDGGRIIGGNQPNAVGQLAFVALVCALLGHKAMRFFGTIVAVMVIYLVNSRSSAAALAVFWLLFFLVPPYGRVAPIFSIRLVAVLGMAVIAATCISVLYQTAILDGAVQWLRLHDPESGLGSGMTGRTTLMTLALGEIIKHPFLGNGFRIEFAQGGHSGYLSLIGETGAIGALILMVAMTWLLAAHLQRACNGSLENGDRRVSKVIIAFMVSNLCVLWVIEPMYISLGFPTQVLLIYLLAKPLRSVPVAQGSRMLIPQIPAQRADGTLAG